MKQVLPTIQNCLHTPPLASSRPCQPSITYTLMQHPIDPAEAKTKGKHIIDPPVGNRRNVEEEVKVSITIIVDPFPTVDCIPAARSWECHLTFPTFAAAVIYYPPTSAQQTAWPAMIE